MTAHSKQQLLITNKAIEKYKQMHPGGIIFCAIDECDVIMKRNHNDENLTKDQQAPTSLIDQFQSIIAGVSGNK